MVGPFFGSCFFFSKWFDFVVSFDAVLLVSDQNLFCFRSLFGRFSWGFQGFLKRFSLFFIGNWFVGYVDGSGEFLFINSTVFSPVKCYRMLQL